MASYVSKTQPNIRVFTVVSDRSRLESARLKIKCQCDVISLYSPGFRIFILQIILCQSFNKGKLYLRFFFQTLTTGVFSGICFSLLIDFVRVRFV